MRNYWTADFLAELGDGAIETLGRYCSQPASPLTQVIIIPGGGAIARVPEDAMAFGHRDAPFNVHYLGMWADAADDERNIDWIRGLSQDMKPHTTGGLYLNFIGDEGTSRVQAAFGDKYDRLVELKREDDPSKLFRLNQNIAP